MGFEPTETQNASTVFETGPFVRSGTLPAARLAGFPWWPDIDSVDIDPPDEGPLSPFVKPRYPLDAVTSVGG